VKGCERQYELWRRFMIAQGEDGNAWYQKHLAKDHPVEISTWVGTLMSRAPRRRDHTDRLARRLQAVVRRRSGARQ